MANLWARQLAAQAWCYPATSKTVMDGDLAEAFADILQGKVEAAVRWAWHEYHESPGKSSDAVTRYWREHEKGGNK